MIKVILRIGMAVTLAPMVTAFIAWCGFLCFGGPLAIMEWPQPYQTWAWVAAGVTCCMAPGLFIYEVLVQREERK